MANINVKPDYHFGHIILESMLKYPGSICQIDAATGEEESYASVLRRSVKLAKYLRSCGFQAGDVLAIGGRNHLDLHIPFYCALFNGYPINGVDPNFKYSEIKALFKITLPKIIFCDKDIYAIYVKVAEDLGLDVKIIQFGSNLGAMSQLINNYGDGEVFDDFIAAEFDIETIYIFLMTTSGTTGKMKVAAFKHRPIIIKMLDYAQTIGEKSKEKVLLLSPVNWISTYYIVCSNAVVGRCKIQTPVVNLDKIIEMINNCKPGTVLTSPSLISDLLKRKDEVDFSCFKVVVATGSKIYHETLSELQACLRKDAFALEAYGQTETIGAVTMVTAGLPLGSCGKCYNLYSIKLVDPISGKDVTEAGIPGEMYVKGPSFTEYYKDPEETATTFTSDGYIKTGDLLYRDKDEFYYFVDRLKNLIKWKNYHVLPTELEQLILTHSGVHDVCVVGLKDSEVGELPAACIIKKNGADVNAQDIKDLVAGQLSNHKHLRGGVIFMDKFPTTSSGKVARMKLQEIALEAQRE